MLKDAIGAHRAAEGKAAANFDLFSVSVHRPLLVHFHHQSGSLWESSAVLLLVYFSPVSAVQTRLRFSFKINLYSDDVLYFISLDYIHRAPQAET